LKAVLYGVYGGRFKGTKIVESWGFVKELDVLLEKLLGCKEKVYYVSCSDLVVPN